MLHAPAQPFSHTRKYAAIWHPSFISLRFLMNDSDEKGPLALSFQLSVVS